MPDFFAPYNQLRAERNKAAHRGAHPDNVSLSQAVERGLASAPFPDATDVVGEVLAGLRSRCDEKNWIYPAAPICAELTSIIGGLWTVEQPQPLPPVPSHPVEIGRWRDRAVRTLHRLQQPAHIREIFVGSLIESLAEFARRLPKDAEGCGEDATNGERVQLYEFFEDAHGVAGRMVAALNSLAARELSLFGAADQNCFDQVFNVSISLPSEPEPSEPEIPEHLWYIHCLLIAASQGGKTNVLRWRIAQLLPHIAQGRASLVLMEPKGVLTNELLHLAELWAMRDRVVILDPSDTRVAFNLFDRGDGSDETINDTIGRVGRVLNTVTANLTQLQRDSLTFAIRAMFSIAARPSMETLIAILRHGKAVLPLESLSGAVRNFFEHDFDGARDGRYVIARLNALLANPVFEALFTGDRTTFDMLAEIQAGKLIVINCSSRALGGESELYGRFWIEELCRCLWPRLALPEQDRTPTTIIIDEAQTYIANDRHIAEILDTAAEAKLGLLLAMHHMEQVEDPHVRHSLYTNVVLKFAANTSADIHNLCRSMGRTKAELIDTLKQFEFAFFTRGMSEAQKVKFPHVPFNMRPRMTEPQFEELRVRNRQRYSHTPADASPPAGPPAAAATPRSDNGRRTAPKTQTAAPVHHTDATPIVHSEGATDWSE